MFDRVMDISVKQINIIINQKKKVDRPCTLFNCIHMLKLKFDPFFINHSGLYIQPFPYRHYPLTGRKLP